MTTAAAEIGRLLAQKEKDLLSGQAALRGMLAEAKRQIVEELAALPGETYTAQMLKANLASVERYLSAFESNGSVEMSRRLDQAWESGADLVPAAMREGGLFVTFGHIPGPLLRTLKDYSAHKISGLASDAFNKIRGELSLGLLGQKTPHQVIQAIAGTLDSPGAFKSLEARAETIAKVEMGRAYSTATVEGLKQASSSVPEMEKQWVHAGHPKVPRVNHVRLHGTHVPVDEPFVIGSLVIDYPRAPNLPAEEVIHCGCDVVPWHPAWGKKAGGEARGSQAA
jgi:hypothetical protein